MFQFYYEDTFKHCKSPTLAKSRRPGIKGGKTQLWHFLLDQLSDINCATISWEGSYGEFKILDPEKLSKMWGEKSGRPKMSYQTMSRALRHYYDKGILSKVKHKKWCYRFSAHALELAIQDDLVRDLPYSPPSASLFQPRTDYYPPYSSNQEYVTGKGLFPNSWSYDLMQYQHDTLGMFMYENFSMPSFFVCQNN